MYRLVIVILGAINICCLALEPVEWLYGTSSKEVNVDYYISPLRDEKTYRIVEEGGAVGPFQAWQRVSSGYETKPTTPVTKAKVFVVERNVHVQESYYIIVNSKSDNEKCFSEDATSRSHIDKYYLDDLNRLCKSNKLSMVKSSDTESIDAGTYSGEVLHGPKLTTTIDNLGLLITASLDPESSQSALIYTTLEGSFIYAVFGLTDLVLKNSKGKQLHPRRLIGRSNLHEWDNKIKFRRRNAGSIAPGKVSGNEADVEDNIED